MKHGLILSNRKDIALFPSLFYTLCSFPLPRSFYHFLHHFLIFFLLFSLYTSRSRSLFFSFVPPLSTPPPPSLSLPCLSLSLSLSLSPACLSPSLSLSPLPVSSSPSVTTHIPFVSRACRGE